MINQAPFETALADDDFDGYVGLFPHINHETGTFDNNRPSFLTQLVNEKIIPESIVAFNITNDNINY